MMLEAYKKQQLNYYWMTVIILCWHRKLNVVVVISPVEPWRLLFIANNHQSQMVFLLESILASSCHSKEIAMY